ncbi:MAG: hypothetical protein AVDCRST_MAG53-252 [uncultured Solirubrobacteraceae bacterium]|uniref:Uncharacterized protein n=1 Tax=uncultured Solirubrobacteraceae bacterium TaxID=1162706 RepID=A0A6J4RNC4_9ACTN|nr:MAG: hypothetical protein AVDCRST_MAG53-252 [uncultured Solirubrobacteraceae bacterium]
MRERKTGITALLTGVAVLWALPTASLSQEGDLERVRKAVDAATGQVERTVSTAVAPVRRATRPAGQAVGKTSAALRRATGQDRAPTATPTTDPPLHGTNNHGQGTVAVTDINPTNERPVGGSTDGSDAGPEEVVVGRARGEQQADGSYRGRITIAALLGQEVAGVTTTNGQTQNGPLQPVQTGVLDPLCNGTAQQVCLSVLRADSTTTGTGSTNDFATARAQLGGAEGIGVGAAESQGTINQDANCQTSSGTSRAANVSSGGAAVADAANSSSTSRSCRGQQPVVTNTSQVIALGGTGVPIPAPGCADGTPDTETGVPTLAPIVCNADTIAGAAGVREALDVFVLQVGGTSLTKLTTAASESMSTAPPETSRAACSDGADNDGDGRVDAADPGCHTDGNAGNPGSFDPNDTSEVDAPRPAGPGTPTAGAPNDDGDDDDNAGDAGAGAGDRAQCADGRDNDGDGVSDRRDPGCHTDGNASNPASFDPDDDSEANGGGGNAGVQDADVDRSGALPFTGTNVVSLALAGLLMLAGGLLLRRQAGVLPPRR